VRTKALTYDTGIGQVDPNLARYLRGPAKFNEGGAADLSSSQQMVPVDPSFRDRLEMLLSDTFGPSPEGRRRADMFMGAAEFVPGVDEGLLFSDAKEAAEQKDYVTTGMLGGLGILSMVPGFPPGGGRSLDEIMESLRKKVQKKPNDTPVRRDVGEEGRYDSGLPESDHAQGRQTRESDIRRQEQTLDLSPEARAARGKDQGFNMDDPLYHYTDADFTEFELPNPPKDSVYGPGIYTSRSSERYKPDAENIKKIPLVARGKLARPGDVSAAEAQIKRQIEEGTRPPMRDPGKSGNWRNEYWTDIHQVLKDKGFTGLQMGEITLIFEPNNLRRIDAEFDPAKTDSANLRAGIGSLAATEGIA
tara:strand:- start:12 stop:1094 length:1083 start_codon:yes stop_codon:yes gene_type:complete